MSTKTCVCTSVDKRQKLKSIKLTVLTVMVFLSWGCEKEYTVAVDAPLQPYVEAFIAEGAARNVQVDFGQGGLIATLDDIPGRSVAGQCYTVQNGPNRIVVDAQQWSRTGAEGRELLIFHELGHCYLGRAHFDAVNDQGQCLSIMRSSVDACDLNFNNDTRSQLLDELFQN